MQLDSVLELLDRLLEELVDDALEGFPARRADEFGPVWPSLALGIAPAGPGDFRLALRTQRRGAAVHAAVEAARGEADVRYVGNVAKLQATRERHRPLVAGISVGHEDITAGTIGCFVRGRDGATAILSNNHVLADENRGATGDAVIQPGRSDGGAPPGDVAARLAEFVPLDPSGSNRVDAAVATVAEGIEVDPQLLGAGPYGDAPVAPEDALGRTVLKVGRTTGLTRGTVSAFDLRNVVVQYDTASAMRFDGQIEVEGIGDVDFSMGGDSGSLVVDAETMQPVGLLFAGSDQGGPGGTGLTYLNPIGEVLDGLGASLYLGE